MRLEATKTVGMGEIPERRCSLKNALAFIRTHNEPLRRMMCVQNQIVRP
jgi:hypothetical protein